MSPERRPSQSEIAGWVEEFPRGSAPALGDPLVLPVDDSDDDNHIVLIHLRYARAAVYLQLDESMQWVATLTERPGDLTGTSLDLIGLGSEVEAAGHLCAHLQGRTNDQMEQTARLSRG